MVLRLEWVVHDSSTGAVHLVVLPLESVDGLQLGNSVTNIVLCKFIAVTRPSKPGMKTPRFLDLVKHTPQFVPNIRHTVIPPRTKRHLIGQHEPHSRAYLQVERQRIERLFTSH